MDEHHSISRKVAKEAYEVEVFRLASAINHLLQNNSVRNIFDYGKFINKYSKSRIGIKALIEESKGTLVIDLSTRSEVIWSLLDTAHIAACTSILKGMKFTEAQFQPENIRKNAINAFPDTESSTRNKLDMIASMLSRLDASRTIEILKIFGLFTRKPKSIRQLALGCGSGINDYESIHQLCNIKLINESTKALLSFDYTCLKPGTITLIDADAIHKERYETLTLSDPSVNGIVGDMSEILENLNFDQAKKYNLVSVLRMEHRMIPDITRFFTKLYPLINKDCDLIFSIGLGEDLSDFKGRVELVESLYDFLKCAKMRPVIFKMHEKGDAEHQLASIKFGHPVLATYQILHCKLNPTLIRKHLDIL